METEELRLRLVTVEAKLDFLINTQIAKEEPKPSEPTAKLRVMP